MRGLLLSGLLCACAQPAPPPTPEQAEMTRIEHDCLAATREGRQMPGWDCGWASLEEARLWQRQYRLRGPRP